MAPRKLIIFGNGLGMALDASHFSLDAALRDIWNRPNFLTVDHKELIERCLGRTGAPQGEYELDPLHQAVSHCKALNQIGQGTAHWLTPDGQTFPEITAKYLHKVATKLHNYDAQLLPSPFQEKLIEFIQRTRSHVATLNYDKLLYNSFIDNNVVSGYDGCLVDGMLSGGFSSDALERLYGKTFGYYLHLHGSPLFVNRGGSVVKLNRSQLTLERDEASQHIVLTHVSHKPSVIAASYVLSTYWEYLQLALSEAEEIILFGYSGDDSHLNYLLRRYLSTTPIHIIEWDRSRGQDQAESDGYWSDKLVQPHQTSRGITVTRLSNITTFVSW